MLYRRFGYLQSRILLQRQDELRVLEEQLEKLDEDDYYNNPHRLQRRELQGETRTKLLEEIESKFCQYGMRYPFSLGYRRGTTDACPATVLEAAQRLMGFNKPSHGDQRSACNYIWGNKPIDPRESAYFQCKEDLITLKAGREHAWLDTVIEAALRKLNCGPIEWVFCSKVDLAPKNVYYGLAY